ncbi:hypothetical protein [Nonomuraea sp. NPDC050783]|uniref:hypothetical protein n=1 Tax=Nonomuraea sp. NPDC050783 TaxID=3154634 RepID=UPI003466AA22
MDRRIDQLTHDIGVDVRAWTHELLYGGRRSRPRDKGTVRTYLMAAHPALITWSATYSTLREVTRHDAEQALADLTGSHRRRVAVALRSLFRFAKRTGRIFADPTRRLSGGPPNSALPMPLDNRLLAQAVEQATTPAQRLVLALAAIHAARPGTLCQLTLDDIDIPNRRITLRGHTRRLDDLTAQLLTEYLRERATRWPRTANPHLFLSERTAHDTQPTTDWWLKKQFRGLGLTVNQIRMDRQLEEALAQGPDALHLAAIFGISERAAIRYANAARQLRENTHEL